MMFYSDISEQELILFWTLNGEYAVQYYYFHSTMEEITKDKSIEWKEPITP